MSAHHIRPWSDAEDKRLMRMYREGYERSLIAESLGRTREAVTKRKRQIEEICPTS